MSNIDFSDLIYDPETGFFIRKFNKMGSKKFHGKVAGYKSKGSILIGVGGRAYFAHRLAWLYVYGEWPKNDIDHIDGNSLNNKLSNLRLATPSENLRNRGKQKNNKSGYKGVYFNTQKNKWQAKINVHNKAYHLGYYDSPQEAGESYILASKELHGEFSYYA